MGTRRSAAPPARSASSPVPTRAAAAGRAPARRSAASMPEGAGPGRVLVAVAHGSADPRSSATIAELAAVARQRSPGLDLRTAFLGHAPPSLPQVLGTIEADREVTVLPLLLTAAYHSKADIPRILARTPRTQGPRVSYGATLGPHPLLLDALDRRLAETDPGAYRDPA